MMKTFSLLAFVWNLCLLAEKWNGSSVIWPYFICSFQKSNLDTKEDGDNKESESPNSATPANDDGAAEEGEIRTEEGAEDPDEVYYDKKKSFFDSISCEALERSKGERI